MKKGDDVRTDEKVSVWGESKFAVHRSGAPVQCCWAKHGGIGTLRPH